MRRANERRSDTAMRGEDLVDFGEIPPAVNEILQEGVALHRHDRVAADAAFRRALALDPTALATRFCLYKIHTHAGDLDAALEVTEDALGEAARQANLAPDWTTWDPAEMDPTGPRRFALYTLKALAFIHLRRDEAEAAARVLARLAVLDPGDAVGGSVVAALAAGSTERSVNPIFRPIG